LQPTLASASSLVGCLSGRWRDADEIGPGPKQGADPAFVIHRDFDSALWLGLPGRSDQIDRALKAARSGCQAHEDS